MWSSILLKRKDRIWVPKIIEIALQILHIPTHIPAPCIHFDYDVSFLCVFLHIREEHLLAPSCLSVHSHVCRHVSAPHRTDLGGNCRSADKSLAWPGRKQANVSVRMALISFGALPCRKKNWQLASRCCWNRVRPWHASELVSFLVGLGLISTPVIPAGLYRYVEKILIWSKFGGNVTGAGLV